MAEASLFATVQRTPAAQALWRRLEPGGVLSCAGVCPGAQPFLAALLRRVFPARPLVVVTAGVKAQEAFQQDLETWLRFGEEAGRPCPRPLFHPAWDILPHEAKLPHVDVISERLETLVALSQAGPETGAWAPVVVTNAVALQQRTFAPAALRARTRHCQRGDRLDPLELAGWLEQQGYAPEAQVNHKGELALRGGILDVFPPTSPWPVRLEFFGDELDSLRQFDPITQISKEGVGAATLPPAGELGILKALLAETATAGGGADSSAGNAATVASLLDHLPSESLLLLCEPEVLAQSAEEYAAQVPAGDPLFIPWPEVRAQAAARGLTVLELEELGDATAPAQGGCARESAAETFATAADSDQTGAPPRSDARSHSESVHLRLESLDAFRPLGERAPELPVAEAQRREFFDQLHRWLRQGYAVEVFCNNDGERERFDEIWRDYRLSRGVEAAAPEPQPPGDSSRRAARPATHLGALTRGFLCEEARRVVVTDAEIFGRYKVQRPRRLKSPQAQTTRSLLDIDFTDLEEGDYVVHVDHGIGRYLGLQLLPAGGGTRPLEKGTAAEGAEECLAIEYAQSEPDQPAPKLYVPVSQAHLVSKYVGAGKARPPLDTLGGRRWARTKEQAQQAVLDLASELLSIQAARESQPGHGFAPDTPWQREFESAFIYEETPDQMHAIQDTKADMEQPKPMDRLICGDVGYGKTEVAIRAAFKAVMDGRQVAVLVPTTVLAQQHFNTFRERMADYPVRLELLSRFRTGREQRRVLEALAAGAVDIVIGTHRLLQDDVAFKDLGLVVIDEEQRFGVLHKERFKRLRRLVDVLTLSATPIPRTLYLALTGARDMSTIETPPADRLPVETIVAPYDERLIRDAIQRELNRQGQVFFLHNRVATIQPVADKLRALVPKARLVVGHGQMHADELEEVMTAFVNGEADVLLSTTIIESGLDIPNANTIIIDRADRFGLSDLYQLRGRVGRYKHQAYAYLLLPRHAGLLTDARKRLTAIRQYSSLGSGFRIAMRDLEIRGAGNLLGPQQSGHIAAVGFDLYCQLLQQSVSTLKGEKPRPRVEVVLRLDFLSLRTAGPVTAAPAAEPGAAGLSAARAGSGRASACVPAAYVADPRQRIEVYRKLAGVTDRDALRRLRDEWRDRFGPLPAPVELLLQAAELRLLAAEREVTLVETQDDKLMLTRNGDFVTTDGKFPRLTRSGARARLNEIKKVLLAL